ncbi:MAG: 1-deoxy-D-xylulose-5-phosphate reductoisomerase, partial [Methylococcales bacterium]|nr:1-deoxy-D-xylulose-5-phosphate reductoisomerase [Methylococcales bacterium]
MKGICILGSTGSIGVSTLDVVGRHPNLYQVIALTANTNIADLFQQCLDHRPQYAVVVDTQKAEEFKRLIASSEVSSIDVLTGTAGLEKVSVLTAVDS